MNFEEKIKNSEKWEKLTEKEAKNMSDYFAVEEILQQINNIANINIYDFAYYNNGNVIFAYKNINAKIIKQNHNVFFSIECETGEDYDFKNPILPIIFVSIYKKISNNEEIAILPLLQNLKFNIPQLKKAIKDDEL